MIGLLPTSLTVGGKDHKIRTDYRDIINNVILNGFANPNLNEVEKWIVAMSWLYVDFWEIPQSDYEEAMKQASWFVDGGDTSTEVNPVKTLDWEQDEKMIFSAVNDAARKEVRELEYLHWWTFLAYMGALPESALTQIMHLRYKIGKGKKLDKAEREFCREYHDVVYLKEKLSDEEKRKEAEDEAFLKELLGI